LFPNRQTIPLAPTEASDKVTSQQTNSFLPDDLKENKLTASASALALHHLGNEPRSKHSESIVCSLGVFCLSPWLTWFYNNKPDSFGSLDLTFQSLQVPRAKPFRHGHSPGELLQKPRNRDPVLPCYFIGHNCGNLFRPASTVPDGHIDSPFGVEKELHVKEPWS